MIPQNSLAVIFAGGKSSRMGRDKALLPFGGFNSLAEYQFRRLSQIFSKVYISAKGNKFNFSAEIITDIYSVSSPLVALISIFETLNIDEVFILSVDSPFVDVEIIQKLYSQTIPSKDATIAKSPNGVEPLCGIYRKGVVPTAKRFFEGGNYRLNSLLQEVNTQLIQFNSVEKFKNLNYWEDYSRAKKP
jgi:molybdopterin-guanine dinucleotide biosynthesis protein A